MRGTFPSSFLQQMFELSNLFVDALIPYSEGCKFPIGVLFGSSIGIGPVKFSSKLHPQSFIISLVCWPYSAHCVAIASYIQLISLL
jgi:hypothetical protein